MAGNQLFYINLGGGLGNVGAARWGFKAPEGTYDNIDGDLGVNKADDATAGVLYGANSPKPPRVRISYKSDGTLGFGATKIQGSVKRFCEPDNLSGVLTGGAINKKKINIAKQGGGVITRDISRVTIGS